MKNKIVLSFILLSSSAFILRAQDTLTIMAYNILNYPNQVSTRYNDLKEIISYVKPDVVLCNEVWTSSGANLLLTNSFNTGSVNYYAKANFVDGPDSDNMLYYNTNKVSLTSQQQIPTSLRDISHYKVHLCGGLDTVWLDLFSLHLKASSGIVNANDRLSECTSLCNYLTGFSAESNIIVGGDFNFYGASSTTEPGFVKLTSNCGENLWDPISTIGEWHANVNFKNVHTQSTRSSTNPGCCGGSTGGLDDRFDFIFINDNVRNGTDQVKYLSGSYYALGNDGNHFNKSIIETPTNTSVPSNVLTALFNMSDHLPVIMKVVYSCDGTLSTEDEYPISTPFSISYNNDEITIQGKFNQDEEMDVELINPQGIIIKSQQFFVFNGDNILKFKTGYLTSGMYILRIKYGSEYHVSKFMK